MRSQFSKLSFNYLAAMFIDRYIKNPGLAFIIKFLGLFLILYYGNYFVFGITAPGGKFYSAFIDDYLNYTAWLRQSILAGAKILTGLLGFSTEIKGEFHLRSITDGNSVQLVYSCLGLGVMSFWTAFVAAHKINWRKKLSWILIGLFSIWFINCCRIAIILIAAVKKWNYNKYMDHHAMFNLVAYVLIFILIILFIRKQGLSKSNYTSADLSGSVE
jgi:exosortase/archaeosortase family protein